MGTIPPIARGGANTFSPNSPGRRGHAIQSGDRPALDRARSRRPTSWSTRGERSTRSHTPSPGQDGVGEESGKSGGRCRVRGEFWCSSVARLQWGVKRSRTTPVSTGSTGEWLLAKMFVCLNGSTLHGAPEPPITRPTPTSARRSVSGTTPASTVGTPDPIDGSTPHAHVETGPANHRASGSRPWESRRGSRRRPARGSRHSPRCARPGRGFPGTVVRRWIRFDASTTGRQPRSTTQHSYDRGRYRCQ